MKKLLSIVLAVMMLLGCMSVTAFAADNNTTEITATVANSLSYEMVIPSAVSMTEAGVKEIGTPSVENVKHATEKTVISYTASGTQLTLVGGTATMATSYYTDSEGETALTDDAIEVYKNSAVITSPTTLYIGVSTEAWDAAENGTYKATVTFNFEAWKALTTIREIMATVEDFPTGYEDFDVNNKYWMNEKASYMLNLDMEALESGDPPSDKLFCMNQDADYLSVSYDTDVTRTGFDYTYTDSESGATVKFNMKNHVLENITISGITGEELEGFLNGTYYNTVLFSSVINETDLPQDISSAWVNENGVKFYKESDAAYIAKYDDSVFAGFEITDTKKVRKIDGNYSLACQEETIYVTFTFNMKDGKVESVTVFSSEAGADILNGTYTAPTVD